MRHTCCRASRSASRRAGEPGSAGSRPARGRRCCLSTASAGPPGTSTELAPLLPGRRLLIPDLPGHGGSAPLPAPSTRGLRRRASPGLLDEPVGVVGHSLGGVVALRLAERRPELVRALVLAAPAGISSSTRLAEVTSRARGARPAGTDRRRGASTGSRARRGSSGSSSGASRSRTRTCSPSARCTASCGAERCTPTRSAPGSRSRATTRGATSTASVPGARPLRRPRPAGAARRRLRVRAAPAGAAARDRRLRPSPDRRAARCRAPARSLSACRSR